MSEAFQERYGCALFILASFALWVIIAIVALRILR